MVHFFGTTECVVDEHPNCQNKHHSIEEEDGKDGTQEGTKEYCSITDEAAGGKVC